MYWYISHLFNYLEHSVQNDFKISYETFKFKFLNRKIMDKSCGFVMLIILLSCSLKIDLDLFNYFKHDMLTNFNNMVGKLKKAC